MHACGLFHLADLHLNDAHHNVATDVRDGEAWIVLASSAYNISLWGRSISIALLE